MKLLSPVDQALLRMENPRAPLHIGALAIFSLPADAPAGFVRKLYDGFRRLDYLPFPYDSRLSKIPIADAVAWKQVRPDADYHVRLHALPAPGTDADLGRLVEWLHSRPLDLTRPVWEAHLIEGLEGGRFAFYFKAHHCATDGMGAMRTITSWLSESPEGLPPVGVAEPPEPGSALELLTIVPRRAAVGLVAMAKVVRRMAPMAVGRHSFVHTAVRTPDSIFNTRVTSHRRIAVQALALADLKRVAKAQGVTVNDVVLAALGGAVRRYLSEQDALPRASLTASVPVGFERDEDTLNAAAGFVVPLGTDVSDPLERLAMVAQRTERGKRDLASLTDRDVQDHFTLTGFVPLLLAQRTGLGAALPRLFNFTVSNIVLAKKPLFLLGARLESIAPISFLVDGYGLNVTLIGYTDKVTLGIVGCRDTVPHLQHLAAFTAEALQELLELSAAYDVP